MPLLTIITIIILLLTTTIILIASLISKKRNKDREKASPFECGFDPNESARLPFSLRFFLIAVIFLIFDVEITLLLPVISILAFSKLSTWILTTFIFLIILLIGLYFEWNQGVLNWTD